MESHMAFIAIAEIGGGIFRPHVCFGEQHCSLSDIIEHVLGRLAIVGLTGREFQLDRQAVADGVVGLPFPTSRFTTSVPEMNQFLEGLSTPRLRRLRRLRRCLRRPLGQPDRAD